MKRIDPKDLSAWKNQTPSDVWDETVRARSEEARLTEEAKRKDATIKALLDQLLATADVELADGPCWCLAEDRRDHNDVCEVRRAVIAAVRAL